MKAAAYTAELFGDKVGRQGCLWVGDAALPQERVHCLVETESCVG